MIISQANDLKQYGKVMMIQSDSILKGQPSQRYPLEGVEVKMFLENHTGEDLERLTVRFASPHHADTTLKEGSKPSRGGDRPRFSTLHQLWRVPRSAMVIYAQFRCEGISAILGKGMAC